MRLETIRISNRSALSLLPTHSCIYNPPQLVQPADQNPVCRAIGLHILSPMVFVQGFVLVLFPASSSLNQLKMPMSFLGHGHRRSSLGPINISPNSPSCSSCLHSYRQRPSIPPLQGKTNSRTRYHPITGDTYILKFSPRSEGDSDLVNHSRSEI